MGTTIYRSRILLMMLNMSTAAGWYFSCFFLVEFDLVMGTIIYRKRILLTMLSTFDQFYKDTWDDRSTYIYMVNLGCEDIHRVNLP
jgi:hypothetical protein